MKSNTLTQWQTDQLLKAENIIRDLYYDLQEKGNEKAMRRADTIWKKIYELMNIQ